MESHPEEWKVVTVSELLRYMAVAMLPKIVSVISLLWMSSDEPGEHLQAADSWLSLPPELNSVVLAWYPQSLHLKQLHFLTSREAGDGLNSEGCLCTFGDHPRKTHEVCYREIENLYVRQVNFSTFICFLKFSHKVIEARWLKISNWLSQSSGSLKLEIVSVCMITPSEGCEEASVPWISFGF